MPFASPSPTQADLRFRLAGIPVRIHPFFWVTVLLLGGESEPAKAIIWVVAVLISILAHELGHAFLQHRFGGRPSIVLYGFGGLSYGNGADDSPRSQILISLAGPCAGFALAGVIVAALALFGLNPRLHPDAPIVVFDRFGSDLVSGLTYDMLYINIWWGLFNLLPIYPLDGGQIAREILTLFLPPATGIVASLWVSIVFAGALAAYFLRFTTGGFGGFFPVILFGLLAFNNYQALEAYRQSRGRGW